MMRSLFLFLQNCGQVVSRLFKKVWSLKRGFLVLVVFLQFLILQRVSAPEVGDYQAFQQVNGTRAGAVAAQETPEQTKKRITSFAGNLVKLGYDWQPGLMVEEGKIQYPRNFHSASFYFDMETNLRQSWLLSRVTAYQKAGFGFDKFLKGAYLSTVELSSQPLVKQLSDHRWQAEVVGIRVVVPSDKKAEAAAFKEKLSFKFIIQETQRRKGHEWGLEQSPLNHALNKVQLDGLKIIDYQELV